MQQQKVDVVMFWDTNPMYTFPNKGKFLSALKKVPTKVSFSESMDETALECDYVCPTTNYLESWSDMNPYSGFYALQQPTISPLFNSRQIQQSLMVLDE